jgi:putative hydroxymethylpyrimidine transport system ATP-binding protein
VSAPAILLDRVSLVYGDSPLFCELTLRLEGGMTTCLLGPSGCGKSTLLKLIAGSGPAPDCGSISLEPEPAGGRRFAWMGQNDLLLPWMTLLDNVLLGAKLRQEDSGARKDRAMALLAAAGLGHAAGSLPAALSGGMRQRGALLRTLMEERPVLLMDEPFSALDALTRVRLQNLTARLTQGATVVLVTHDPMEALRLGHRIVVLAGNPAGVAAELAPAGTPPRNPGEPELARQYGELLALLMNGEAE